MIDLQWYVVRTQPKREKKAAEYLRREVELEVLAPQVRYAKATKRGKVMWVEAMFPGYIFVLFDRAEHERAVCYAPGVMTLVKFGNDVPTLDASIMESLKETLNNEETLTLSLKVEEGETYEVADGPLQGQEGTVIEVLPGGERVRMLLEVIGGERAVDVDIYSLLLPERPDADK